MLTTVVILAAILTVHAQLSGLNIASSGETNMDPARGTVTIKGIEKTTAVLRKTASFNEDKKEQIITAKDPIEANKEVPAKEIKKSPSIKNIPTPTVTTSGTIYDITGSTSLHQYTSLQANFKCTYEMHGLGQQQYNNFNINQSIELYKIEKGNNVRSFCIPSTSCTSVNIPIQLTGNGLRGGVGAGAGSMGGYFTVVVPSGYLQPGEYVFIDKSSLTTDGASLICFAFTVKQ